MVDTSEIAKLRKQVKALDGKLARRRNRIIELQQDIHHYTHKANNLRQKIIALRHSE